MEKKCFKCGEVKPLSFFYKHPKMADGRVNKCKECNKKDVRENRALNIDYYREYDADRAMLPHRIEARQEYQKTPEGVQAVARSSQKWRANNPVKKAAQTILGNAVRDGKISKPSNCSECGESNIRIHGHHDDYAFPLSVRWLCPACHVAWHRENGEAANG